MRKTLLSLSVIAAVGSTLVAGGAFSVFNDSGTATGTYRTGTVKLGLGANKVLLPGDCSTVFTDATHADPTQNMGSVNNTRCTSTLPVTNAGSLPMSLAASSAAVDAIKDAAGADAPGSTCFSSVITPADLVGVLLPGATRNLHIVTTASTDNACQAFSDTVTTTVNVVEALAPVAGA